MKTTKSQLATLTSSRAFRTFLPFLFLSYIIWSLTDFASEKDASIPIKINYINSPQNKLLINVPQNTFHVAVKASGFNILRKRMFKKEQIINLKESIFTSDTTSYILSNNFFSTIQNKLPSEMKVLRIQPDTLFFHYKTLIQKEVPIKLKATLDFQKGFSNTDSIYLKPNKITIFGTKEQLDKIKFIETTPLVLKTINSNLFQKIALAKKETIKYSLDSVQLIANVDQMIAGKITLPFTLKHLANQKISTFPQKITLEYKAPLEVYKNLKPNDFSIICDLKKSKNGSLSPEIIKKPSLLKITDIKPKTIQFLIK